jgi:hypothetical protein
VRSLLPSVLAAAAGFGAAYWFFAPSVDTSLPLAPSAETGSTETKASDPSRQRANSPSEAPKPANFTGDLKTALAAEDPFLASAHVLAWVKSATAEDFAKFAKDPKSFPFPKLNRFSPQFHEAYFHAIAERWLAVDPDAFGAMRRVHAAFDRTDFYIANQFLGAAARLQPEAVLAKLEKETDHKLTFIRSETLRHLAETDAKKARSLLQYIPEKDKKGAEAAIICGIASSDPLSAAALAREVDEQQAYSIYRAIASAAERIGPGMLRQVIAAGEGRIEKHAEAMPALLFQHPDLAGDLKASPESNFPLFTDLDFFQKADLASAETRSRLLANYNQLPDGTREQVGAALAATWARTDPQAAAAWALEHAKPNDPDSIANHATHYAFLRWSQADRPAALAWLRSLPDSPLRKAVGTHASTFLAEEGQMEAALELFRPSGSPADQRATAHLAQIYAPRDPAAAAQWLAKLPEESVNEAAVAKVLEAWYPQNSAACAEWVESLPPGSRRNEALKAFIANAAAEGAAGAAAWIETIDDPKFRQNAAETIYYSFKRENPNQARVWLDQLQGVDEAWKAQFLRRPK